MKMPAGFVPDGVGAVKDNLKRQVTIRVRCMPDPYIMRK